MVTEAVAETTTETEPSTASTPPSADTPALVPDGTAAPQDQGGETPASTEPVSRSTDSYNLEELNQLYGQGKLSDPTLVTRRESLLQSDNDRRTNEQNQLARQRAADEQRVTELAELKGKTAASLKANRERMMSSADPDLELYAEREQGILDDYHSKSEAIHLAPHEQGLRDALLRVHGDTPRNRQAVNAKSLPELISDIYGAAYNAGRQTGPDDSHIVMEKKAYDKAISDASQKALDDYKAANPPAGTVSTAGTNGRTVSTKHPRDMTEAEYAVWHDETEPDDRNRAWLAT